MGRDGAFIIMEKQILSINGLTLNSFTSGGHTVSYNFEHDKKIESYFSDI